MQSDENYFTLGLTIWLNLMIEDKTVEDKILESATKNFLKKGFSGTRMQEIADDAEINKAMLHYYFRSKEKLYRIVFQKVLSGFIRQIEQIILSTEKTIEEKIAGIIKAEQKKMSEDNIPMFLLQEIRMHPDLVAESFGDLQINKVIKGFISQLKNENIEKAEAEQIFVSVVSLSLFPIIAKDIIQLILGKNDGEYGRFMNGRTKHIEKLLKLN